MYIKQIYGNFTDSWVVLFLRTFAIAIALSVCCSCTKAGDNIEKYAVNAVDDSPVNSELKTRGKNLRSDAENTFQEMNKTERNDGYDLKNLCSKYIPAGTSFTDLEIILRAAGMQSKLQSVKFYSADIDEAKGDFAVEIVFNEALPRTSFYIVIRPDSSNTTNKKVGAVTGCSVSSVYP